MDHEFIILNRDRELSRSLELALWTISSRLELEPEPETE